MLVGEGALPADVLSVNREIADPKNPEHGDFATNFAMVSTKVAGKPPREIADLLAAKLLELHPSVFAAIEVAGPGFINFRLNPIYVSEFVPTVLTLGENGLASASRASHPQKINVEFVSVNPNGPITIGSGRGAAYGSTLCNVLEAVGHEIYREYYVNDGVSSEQMRLFAESVRAIMAGLPVPDNGYKGDYVHDVAHMAMNRWVGKTDKDFGTSSGGDISEFMVEHGDENFIDNLIVDKSPILEETTLAKLLLDSSTQTIQEFSQSAMLSAQKSVLHDFGVDYDVWSSEQALHISGFVNSEIDGLIAKGIADTQPTRTQLKLAKGFKIEDVLFESQTAAMEDEDGGDKAGAIEIPAEGETLWLRSTKLGDDMDRVLRRKDGRLTYIASDVSYHKDKLNRPANADKMITILGPDHHGYIGRLTAVVAAMLMKPVDAGAPCENEIDAKLYRGEGEKAECERALAEAKQKLEVQIYQLVRFLKDGKPAPMRKRDGNIYALIDLMKEIGAKLKPEATAEEQLASGKDVARFFYLMRSHDTTFDFDLDLAERQSDENPVFYVQYAHARICSIIEKAARSFDQYDAKLLVHDREKALIKKICDLPDEVRRASEDYGVHRIATYTIELAKAFHYFYDGCRVIQDDQPELTHARLALCEATAVALRSGLNILGVSAPKRM